MGPVELVLVGWAVMAVMMALLWLVQRGVALWTVAVAGESLADVQLARFAADPHERGLTCRGGIGSRRGYRDYQRTTSAFVPWSHTDAGRRKA